MRHSLCLILFFTVACSHVSIKDKTVYGDKGELGAVVAHTLANVPLTYLDKPTWDAKRFGMLCVSVDDFAEEKKELEQLCSMHNNCDYQTLLYRLQLIHEDIHGR